MKLLYAVVCQVISLAILPLTLDYKLASSVVQAHSVAVLCPQVDDFPTVPSPYVFSGRKQAYALLRAFPSGECLWFYHS